MDHLQKLNALQTLEFPLFLQSLEKKYDKGWVEKNVASMAILCEEGAGGMFRTLGSGTNANMLKIAHAVIRTLAKLASDKDPNIDERQAAVAFLKTIAAHIGGDFAREGVPDTIFNAVVSKQDEDTSPPVDGITPPIQ